MTTSSNALDDELNIPTDATISVQSKSTSNSTSSTAPALVTASSMLSSIPLSPTTSIHKSTKYLLVGRQANKSDIRINHKSISRKHAVLYFHHHHHSTNDDDDDEANDDNIKGTTKKGTTLELILKDLGGKFGCTVNGMKVGTNSSIVLHNGDSVIFGNVREQLFNVQLPTDLELVPAAGAAAGAGADEGAGADGGGPTRNETSSDKINVLEQGKLLQEDNGDKRDDTLEQQKRSLSSSSSKPPLTGRAAREAEIAAMMESFDNKPAYKKFIPTNDDNANILNNTNTNITTSIKGKQSTRRQPSREIKYDDRIPISQSITIPPPNPTSSNNSSSSSSLATTLSLDPSGSRLLVGMSNATIRLYDFNGMDLSLQPFKTISIQEGRYSIISTTFSNSGDKLIIGSTSAQPIILDRDGSEIIEFSKGDMYVTDMAHTDGHVANITGVDWHPFDREVVLTSSLDGSVRRWDLDRGKTKFDKLCCGKKFIYRIKSSFGKKTKVTCVKFSPAGREFVCGTSCGSIQIWNSTKVGSRPDRVIYDAHGKNNISIHSLVYNYDGSKLASRCMDDDCVKIWETRKLSRTSKPIAICPGLPSHYEYSNVSFSPDGNFVCAGTSVEPRSKLINQSQGSDEEYGKLKIFNLSSRSSDSDSDPPELVVNIDIANHVSVITCCWHKKLNQIILGLSDGSIRVFYDPNRSTKGALLPVSKGVRKEDELSLLLASRAPTGSAGINLADIQTPNALPLFRDPERNTKRKREKERLDPIKSKRPDMPGTGIKAGESTSAGLNFQQYNLTSAITKNKNIAGKDPRDELFKYKEGKNYTHVEYDGDIKILAEKTAEEEEEEHAQ